MKIQDLAIIFVLIILPISLVLSIYTQYQIQTINTQTLYDQKLTSATYDAIKAFQINSINSTTSDIANSKLRDIEASIATFQNSIMSTFELNGYAEDDLNNYIPALVYTLYDGFYIYSPYENTNYQDDNGEKLYGLKPYITYSCRYVYPKNSANPSVDVVITYALDNYITVQGKINGEYVNKSGYLVDNIELLDNYNVKYNNIEIAVEQLKEYVPIADINGNIPETYSYAKVNGTKYYLVENYLEGGIDAIVYILNGLPAVQYKEGDIQFISWKNMIINNDSAIQYYKDAYEFTTWLKGTDLIKLTYADAIDEVILDDGSTTITNVWSENTMIFKDSSNNIENETSTFNEHRLAVIRHKIETNLAIAISNYNSYSGADNVFQMPELKEDEWEHITHNISLISFLQGLHIGGKIYNGYSLVTNSESKEVVLEENIYILGYNNSTQKYNYHRIGDKGFEDGTISVDAGGYGGKQSAGRLNLDFERTALINNDNTLAYYYYYPLKAYNASYDSVVMQNNVTTYDDIYEYINGQSYELKQAFYTALGRERASKYNSNNVVENNGLYLPSGYTFVENTDFDTGLVIENSEGNQFVWVEVPRTVEVYQTAGLNITSFTDTEYGYIEEDLKRYTSTYRRGTAYKDEYYSDEATGLTQENYNNQKKKMLKSIYKNGGFYVGRYETGIKNSPRTAKGDTTQTAVIQANAYPYNYVTNKQAQTLASNFATSGYTSSLMFGVQWDLMLKYLETKGATTTEIMTNSKGWGNYSNSVYKITNTSTKNYINWTWNSSIPYTHNDGDKALLTTGASSIFSKQNIFDIGGNVYEWTLEYSSNTSNPCTNRGGNYAYTGTSFPAGSRGKGTTGQANYMAGFRVALYKDEGI